MNWIIGDIHGELTALKNLVDLVSKRDADAHFNFVGDFVDRGKDSSGCVDLIIALGNKATPVRGNHDDVWDTVINGASKYADAPLDPMEPVNQLMWFTGQGMLETLNSYKVPQNVFENFYYNTNDKEKALAALEEIRAFVPDQHKQFFKNLPLVNEQETFFCGHAYLPFHVEDNINEWVKDKAPFQKEMLWGRFAAIAIVSSKRWKKTGYFGHSPTHNYRDIGGETPITGPKIRLVDTGCVFGHRLTAYCHEEDTFIQVHADGEEVKG